MHERNVEFDELLDDAYPEVRIAFSVFSPSDVLFTMDPICYEMSVNEWLDTLEDN